MASDGKQAFWPQQDPATEMGRQAEEAIGGIKRSWRRPLIGCRVVRDARALGLVQEGTWEVREVWEVWEMWEMSS